MSRSASESDRPPVAERLAVAVGPAAAGFTLIELLIAMAVSVLLGAGLVRFYKDSYRAYSLQDQIQERDQNAHFAVTRFTELLQQGGAGLPDTGWNMITQTGGITLVAVNPRNATQFISYNLPLSQYVPVSDASQWLYSGNVLLNVAHVLIDYADIAKVTQKIAIDTAYNLNGFVKGVKNNATGMDSIRLAAAVALSVGDRVYGYREDQYLLTGGTPPTNLVLRPNGSTAAQMVLAENIDSLVFVFKDAKGVPTTAWKSMRSASVLVRARTALADPRYPGQYRRLSLPMNVILRNRI